MRRISVQRWGVGEMMRKEKGEWCLWCIPTSSNLRPCRDVWNPHSLNSKTAWNKVWERWDNWELLCGYCRLNWLCWCGCIIIYGGGGFYVAVVLVNQHVPASLYLWLHDWRHKKLSFSAPADKTSQQWPNIPDNHCRGSLQHPATTSFTRSNRAKWLSWGHLNEHLNSCQVLLGTKKRKKKEKKNPYGCCQWSPVRCLSSGGCRLAWKPRFPRCRGAECLSVAVHWWAAPSMLPELWAATDCSRSPP